MPQVWSESQMRDLREKHASRQGIIHPLAGPMFRSNHIFTQTHPDERTLEYSEGEEKVVATILTYLQHHLYGHLFNLGKG